MLRCIGVLVNEYTITLAHGFRPVNNKVFSIEIKKHALRRVYVISSIPKKSFVIPTGKKAMNLIVA
jgi:hypothetical protein